MNILITGANGLLGSELVNILSGRHKIFAVVEENSRLKFSVNHNIIIIRKICQIWYKRFSKRYWYNFFLANPIDLGFSWWYERYVINIYAPLKIIKWAIVE